MVKFASNMLIFNNKKATLYDSVVSIVAPIRTKEIYKIIVHESAKLVGANYGSIFIVKNKKLRRTYSTIPSKRRVDPSAEGFTYKAFEERRIYVLQEQEIKRTHAEMFETGTKSLIIMPLIYKKKALGVLVLRSERRFYFDRKKVDVLKLFISVAGLKIGNSFLRETLDRELKFRKEFSSLASHELKTPITIISIYSEMIRTKYFSGKQLKDEWFTTVQTQVDRMTNIINEFLTNREFKKVNLKYKWEKTNLYELLEQIIKNYSVTHPTRKIEFSFDVKDEKFIVLGDHNKLHEVFVNVINNAIKYSSLQSLISINIRRKNGKIFISIKDRGNGISEHDMPYIFEAFYRGGKTKKPGSGMGLYLSKNIIDAHKGKIKVNSIINKGTSIVIQLPSFVEEE